MNLLNPRSRVGADKQLVVLVFLTEHVPLFAVLAAAMGLFAYLENHFKLPNLVAFATAWSLMLATRLTRSGGRTAYYRIDNDMWQKVIQRRIASMMSFGEITRDGVALLGADRPRAARISAAHDFFEWMARLLASSPGPPSAKARGR